MNTHTTEPNNHTHTHIHKSKTITELLFQQKTNSKHAKIESLDSASLIHHGSTYTQQGKEQKKNKKLTDTHLTTGSKHVISHLLMDLHHSKTISRTTPLPKKLPKTEEQQPWDYLSSKAQIISAKEKKIKKKSEKETQEQTFYDIKKGKTNGC